MNNRIILFVIGILILFACSKDEESYLLPDFTSKEDVTIKPQDALSSLDNILKTIGTKSQTNLSTNELFVIGKKELFAKTKSSETIDIPDTLLYALNFENGGFALMAGNSKINNSVLCVTESGNIGYNNIHDALKFLDDTETNNNTKSTDINQNEDFVDAGQVYVYSLLLSSAILDYFDGESLSDDESLVTKDAGGLKYGPFLTTKWTQGGPFDDLTPNNCPAGCVVIAVAQIMAYNNKPASSEFITASRPWMLLEEVYPYNNVTYAGSSHAQSAVAYMAMILGNVSNCAVDYSPSGSGSNTDRAKKTLKNYGYKNVDKRLGCESEDKKRIDKQIAAGRPVYMAGKRKDSGHAWVIDGLDGNYYHINWGWKGDCDGYYTKGTFNTSARNSYDPVYDPGTDIMQGRDYYHYFRILLYEL